MARAVHGVSDEVREVGREADRSQRKVTVLNRALEFMAVRATVATVAIGGVGAATILALPALGALGAALVAAAILAAPLAAVFGGTMMAIHDTQDIAGSSAQRLLNVWAEFKTAFRVMTFGAAAAVMRGLAEAMQVLMPVMRALRPAMTAFGEVLASALVVAAQGLAANAPLIEQFLTAAAPLFMQLAQHVGPLTEAFLRLGIVGVPAMLWLVNALVDFLTWLPGAVMWAQSLGSAWDWLLPAAAGILALVGAIRIAAAIQALWNAVLLMNPIGLIIIAIVALVALLAVLYMRSETVRNAMTGAWDAIKTAFQAAYDFIKPKIEWLIDKLEKVGNFLGIGGGPSGFGGGGGLLGLEGVPLLQHGGVIPSGGAGIVGEAGPELVTAGSSGAVVTPGAGGGEVHWQPINVYVGEEQVARATFRAVRKAQSTR